MAKRKDRKKGPSPPREAEVTGQRQFSSQSSGALESSDGLGKGTTTQVVAHGCHNKSDEVLVLTYVCVTLIHAMALWAALKMIPGSGVEAASHAIHVACEVLDRIRQGLFYVHAYLAAKAWWA